MRSKKATTSRVFLGVWVTPQLRDRIRARAVQEQRLISTILMQALESGLDQRERAAR